MYCFTCFSWAEDNGEGSDDLWLAKTRGIWSEKGKYGYYRVMLYRMLGRSHSADSVVVDILEQSGTESKKVRSIKLDLLEYKGYVVDISLKQVNDTTMAVLLDIEMKAMYGLVLREIFLVSPDGNSRRLVEAKYQDIFGDEK